jgi:hypothetical protein
MADYRVFQQLKINGTAVDAVNKALPYGYVGGGGKPPRILNFGSDCW